MKLTKLTALLLAILMMASTLVACGVSDNNPSDTTSREDSHGTGSEASTELTDDLPDDLYYNNDEITIISRYR